MTNTAIQEPLIQENTPFFVGEILKTERLAQGLTLEQVSKNLRISLRQLSRLEENEDNLICDVYTMGFLKLYAQYLGLNVEELLKKFKDQGAPHSNPAPLVFPAPLPGKGIPSRAILGFCFCALSAIIAGWWWIKARNQIPFLEIDSQKIEGPALTAEVPVAPITEATQPVHSSVPLSTLPPVETQPVTLQTGPQKVDLQVTEEAWIEVKDQEGNIVVNRIFYPGESFEFKDSENLILTTGNLKGTHLSAGDKIFPTSEKSGEVGRNISLNPEKWLE